MGKRVEANRAVATSGYPEISVFGIGLLGGLLLVVVQRLVQKTLSPAARFVIVRKSAWSEKVYASKVTRFGSAIFKMVFFTAFSIYSYVFVLRDAEWTPP